MIVKVFAVIGAVATAILTFLGLGVVTAAMLDWLD